MIGLLQCDHVDDQFRASFGDYDDMFRRWLPDEWRVYDVTRGEVPADVRECDCYVTTGSKASVYDDEPWIHRLAQLVREIYAANHSFLGVCFGHQMMAHALEGRVMKSSRGWGIGVHEFQVAVREPWMLPPLDRFGLLMSCQDQVTSLPSGSIVLAGNEHCPVGLFRVGSMLGIQGHPEFPKGYSSSLMQLRAENIGVERVRRAMESLSLATHSEELAGWARAFLGRP